jgi:hypothetical protein
MPAAPQNTGKMQNIHIVQKSARCVPAMIQYNMYEALRGG